VHGITIRNNKMSPTVLMLKYIDWPYLKNFRVVIFLNTAEFTQRLITRPIFMYQHSFYRLFFVCSNKKSFMLFVSSGIFLITMYEPLCVIFLSHP